jgi:zinc transport system substrate-binding protein
MMRILSIVSILFILLFNVVCTSDVQTEKINIVVSILPLAEFTEKIGGDKVQVSVMVPPGAAPHTYEPTPGQFIEVSKTKMYVKVGSAIDFEVVWFDKLRTTNRAMVICDASAGLELVHDDDNDQKRYDPHVWLSVKNAKIMVKNIYTCLCAIDSMHTGYYAKNLELYLSQLDSLDSEIEQLLSAKSHQEFIVYHPAWTYFARDYHLEQIPVEIEGKQPTAKNIQQLIDYARINNIKCIFASPQFNRESADVIAREIGGRVVFIDPLEKNFTANMSAVAQAVSEALE